MGAASSSFSVRRVVSLPWLTAVPFRLLSGFLLLAAAPRASAAQPFKYPERSHGPATLRYVEGVPVLTVSGTPRQIGEQIGALALKPARRLISFPRDMLKQNGVSWLLPFLELGARRMAKNFPPAYRRELAGMAKASGVSQADLLLANTVFDLYRVLGCSTLTVEAARSATGAPLFGRNLDFPTLGYLHEYSLVTVYRPRGKRPFVSIGFPGMVGCLSGMNDAGLALAVLEVYESRDESRPFNAQGMPYAMAYRWLLENCATTEQAEAALRKMKRTVMTNLAVCDRRGGTVFELTPAAVEVRRPVDGICAATNHFRSAALRTWTDCDRYAALTPVAEKKLSLSEIKNRLHAANQGGMTLQTMIFEPATLTLHLAIGEPPTSSLPFKKLDLAPWLAPGKAPRRHAAEP